MKFSIRDLLWLTVVVALCCGWWATYQAGFHAAKQEQVWRENSIELGAVLETANVSVTFDADGTMHTKHIRQAAQTPNPTTPARYPPSE